MPGAAICTQAEHRRSRFWRGVSRGAPWSMRRIGVDESDRIGDAGTHEDGERRVNRPKSCRIVRIVYCNFCEIRYLQPECGCRHSRFLLSFSFKKSEFPHPTLPPIPSRFAEDGVDVVDIGIGQFGCAGRSQGRSGPSCRAQSEAWLAVPAA